jgi:hypothetical protein
MKDSAMNRRYFLGAYWPARKEAIEKCADRLFQFISNLSTCDSALEAWYEQGWSRKQALEKQAHIKSRNYLLDLLDRGRSRRDIDKSVVDDLGFSIGLWNGAATEEKEAGLGITCGLYTSNPNLGNCVTLDFPKDLGELMQPERMAHVLSVVAESWEPDWAGVMSTDAMNAREFNARLPFVDWMLYLSNKLMPQISALPQPVSVQRVEELGSILIVQGEPPDPTNLEHVRNVERIGYALRTMT